MKQSSCYKSLFAALAILPGLTHAAGLRLLTHEVIVEFQYPTPSDGDRRHWEMGVTGTHGKEVEPRGPDVVGAIQLAAAGDAASFKWSKDTDKFRTRECFVHCSEYPGVDTLVWQIGESSVVPQLGLIDGTVHVECSHLVEIPR